MHTRNIPMLILRQASSWETLRDICYLATLLHRPPSVTFVQSPGPGATENELILSKLGTFQCCPNPQGISGLRNKIHIYQSGVVIKCVESYDILVHKITIWLCFKLFVCLFVCLFSCKSVRIRTTSIYLPEHIISQYPLHLCSQEIRWELLVYFSGLFQIYSKGHDFWQFVHSHEFNLNGCHTSAQTCIVGGCLSLEVFLR